MNCRQEKSLCRVVGDARRAMWVARRVKQIAHSPGKGIQVEAGLSARAGTHNQAHKAEIKHLQGKSTPGAASHEHPNMFHTIISRAGVISLHHTSGSPSPCPRAKGPHMCVSAASHCGRAALAQVQVAMLLTSRTPRMRLAPHSLRRCRCQSRHQSCCLGPPQSEKAWPP